MENDLTETAREMAKEIREAESKTTTSDWRWERIQYEKDEDGERIYVPQCSYMGSTLIQMADTYENGGFDAHYLTLMAENGPDLAATLEALAGEVDALHQKIRELKALWFSLDGFMICCGADMDFKGGKDAHEQILEKMMELFELEGQR